MPPVCGFIARLNIKPMASSRKLPFPRPSLDQRLTASYQRLHLEMAEKVGPSRRSDQQLCEGHFERPSDPDYFWHGKNISPSPVGLLSRHLCTLSLQSTCENTLFSFFHIQIATNCRPSGQKPFPSFHSSREFQSILFSPSNETVPQHSGELHRFGTPEDLRVYVLQLHVQSLSTDRGGQSLKLLLFLYICTS